MAQYDGVIDQAVDNSVQRDDVNRFENYGVNSLLTSLVDYNGILPPWWSKRRDAALRKYWKSIDHLSGAVYTMQSKLTSIPFVIYPRDMSNRRHVAQAKEYTDRMYATAEYGDGWVKFLELFIEDFLCTDAGAFAEIIGGGRPDGPIEGRPITVSHLDSARCTLTGNYEYPVLYTDNKGDVYKLHRTRVMHASSMPSPIREMNGVGFSAVSRCVNAAQTLFDMITYKQEKLGSRPHRGIVVTRGGLSPEEIIVAFSKAEAEMGNVGLKRYSKMVVVGEQSLPDANIDIVDLAKLPDGFDEETSTFLGVACIALAFGMDSREIWPAMHSGQTRADAIMQHVKQRGKGPGQILTIIERLFTSKYLPPHLYMSFDYQDDTQDRQSAETGSIRSQGRERNLANRTWDVRTAREIMEANGEITHEQLVKMELADGRLSDGSSILNVFYSNDYMNLFSIPYDDPLNVEETQLAEMETHIANNARNIRQLIANTPDGAKRDEYSVCLYALMALARHYGFTRGFPELQQQATDVTAGRMDDRVRSIPVEYPSNAERNPSATENMREDWDDTEQSVSVA